MSPQLDHIEGVTFHGRKGSVSNDFRYSVDYVLFDAEAEVHLPGLIRRNRPGILSLWDADCGGVPKQGRGASWVRDVLRDHQILGVARIELLAQPRVLGHVFNPVSFWFCRDPDERLIAVIAEVTNTYGDRHSYLCHHSDFREIGPTDRLRAQKILHVSPFQPVEGLYEFRFDIREDRIGIWIDYAREHGGLIATLTGTRRPATNRSLVRALIRRPFGSRRVLTLIHWQALKLWWKNARFRPRPTPPANELSSGWSAQDREVPGE